MSTSELLKHRDQATQRTADEARLLLEANLICRDASRADVAPADRKAKLVEAMNVLLNEYTNLAFDAQALNQLARIEMDAGLIDQAFHRLNTALSLAPNDSQILQNLGYAELMRGNPNLASTHFHAALDADKSNAAAFVGIAHAKAASGDHGGAFVHYGRLLELGGETPSVRQGMAKCAQHLKADKYTEALESQILTLLNDPALPHQHLGRFAASLLREKYRLADADAVIELDRAAADPLLLSALETTLLPDPQVETFLTLLRQAITLEVHATGTLRDELHELCIALGIYGERVGYVMFAGQEEQDFTSTLRDQIDTVTRITWVPADVTGALMVASMYADLFHQPYSPALCRFVLADWPVAAQALMQVSLYRKVEQEAYKQQFAEKRDELNQKGEDIAHAWPNWSNLEGFHPQSLRSELERSLRINTDKLPETLRVLFIGARSGQRAIEFARFFSDVEVIASDESLSNLAHATTQANGLNNIVFWPMSLVEQFIADGNPVNFVEVAALPSDQSAVNTRKLIETGLAAGGVLHLHTGEDVVANKAHDHLRQWIAKHRIACTSENIRLIRQRLLEKLDTQPWRELLNADDFYLMAACQHHWFNQGSREQLSDVLEMLGANLRWKLVKVTDQDHQSLATGPVSQHLAAQAKGDAVRHLAGHGLNLYVVRR